MQINVSLPALRRVLILALAALIYMGLCVEIWDGPLDRRDPLGLVALLGLSYETNLPTWFSSTLLFSCAMTLLLIGRGKLRGGEPFVRHWLILALAFFYISVDEFVQLHERLNQLFEIGGAFFFGWIIPAGIVVTIFGLSYLRFLGHLPQRTRRRFMLAGAIYVGGALGVEIPLGIWTDQSGRDFVYGMIDLVEESMEMIGASLFLYSLVEYLAECGSTVSFSLAAAGAPATPADEAAGVAAAPPSRSWRRLIPAAGVAVAIPLLAVGYTQWTGPPPPPVGKSLSHLAMAFYNTGEAKGPETKIRLWVTDMDGTRYLDVNVEDAMPANGMHKAVLPFDDPPARSACDDLTLHFQVSHNGRGPWSWTTRMYVAAITSTDEQVWLNQDTREYAFSSEKNRRANAGRITLSCPSVGGGAD